MNDNELKAKDILEKAGWTVLRNGWPDFLCEIECPQALTPDKKRIAAVEVKCGTDTLSPEQKAIHKRLEEHGIPVFVVRPDRILEMPYPRWNDVSKRYTAHELMGELTTSERNLAGLEEQIHSIKRQIDAMKFKINSMAFLLESSSARD